MTFQVKFFSQGLNKAIAFDEKRPGLRHLDKARAETGLNLHPEVVYSYINRFSQDPWIEVSEHFARKSGHFEDQCEVQVTCPKGMLNAFTKEVLDVRTNKDTGEVRRIEVLYEVQTQEILKAWEEAGFPLEWVFE